MKQLTLCIIVVVCAVAGSVSSAQAGVPAGSIGVGAEFQLSGAGGLSMNYDAGKFHVGGFFGFFDPPGANNTELDVGGRFFFHIAQTAASDFSLGGSVGIASFDNGAGNRQTAVFIEPGFQIRVFIVPNVALSFTGGIEIGAGADARSELNITGGLSGTAGVHYYF